MDPPVLSETVSVEPVIRWFAPGTRPWVGSESGLSDQYEPHGTVTNFGYYHKIHKGVTNVGTELYGENRIKSFTNRQGKVCDTKHFESRVIPGRGTRIKRCVDP